jgi:hypothetical protein
MAVGNRRADMIDKIDRILWNVLLGAINAPDDLPSLLQAALEKVDLNELRNLEEYELKLFEPGKCINLGVPFINHIRNRPWT